MNRPDTLAQAAMAPERPPAAADDFEAFVHATGDRIYRAAYVLCGNHHLAEDLTQTTYAKVYAAWSRVASADSPLGYTRTVLVRSFYALKRRRLDEHPVDVLPERSASPPDAERRLDVLVALRRLSPQDRSVLTLRYWEDLSVAETAAILGIGENACRTRAFRALVRLRLLLPDLDLSQESS